MTAKAVNSRSLQHPYSLARSSDPSLAVPVAQLVFRCHSAPAKLALETTERYLGEKACVLERETDDLGNRALMPSQHAMNFGRMAGHNVAAGLLGLRTTAAYSHPK